MSGQAANGTDQIVGYFINETGTHGFLATPTGVPAPSPWCCLARDSPSERRGHGFGDAVGQPDTKWNRFAVGAPRIASAAIRVGLVDEIQKDCPCDRAPRARVRERVPFDCAAARRTARRRKI
jgi:hypothetical protein